MRYDRGRPRAHRGIRVMHRHRDLRSVVVIALALVICSLPAHVEATAACGAIQPSEVTHEGDTLKVTGRFDADLSTYILENRTDIAIIELIDSPGGLISHMREVAAVVIPIRVSGEKCQSACAMLLTTYDHVCLSSSVQTISFHSISTVRCEAGRRIATIDAQATTAYVDTLRPPLRAALERLPQVPALVDVPTTWFLEVYPERACGRR